ncbi:MAG: ion transporter [Arcobacteraceae bacterium]|jgi:voltage-gated sodium channel|nr:ion transporter [Arcobacteraceae bacterium]
MEKIKNIVENQRFINFIIVLIIINGITMGLETSKVVMGDFGTWIDLFDSFVITVFTIEILMKISVYRGAFFKDPWNLFDFTIVTISLVPTTSGFEIFRVLRVLRLFRLVTVIPQMRKIVLALASVIPGMASIAGLLTLLFYIFAIMATQLFGEAFPEWFGTLGESFYTLFQVMTLESWSMGIARPVMEQFPMAWLFFVPFIFIVTFIMINLIIAVVVDAMNELKDDNNEVILDEIHTNEDKTLQEIQLLRSEIQELKELLVKK